MRRVLRPAFQPTVWNPRCRTRNTRDAPGVRLADPTSRPRAGQPGSWGSLRCRPVGAPSKEEDHRVGHIGNAVTKFVTRQLMVRVAGSSGCSRVFPFSLSVSEIGGTSAASRAPRCRPVCGWASSAARGTSSAVRAAGPAAAAGGWRRRLIVPDLPGTRFALGTRLAARRGHRAGGVDEAPRGPRGSRRPREAMSTKPATDGMGRCPWRRCPGYRVPADRAARRGENPSDRRVEISAARPVPTESDGDSGAATTAGTGTGRTGKRPGERTGKCAFGRGRGRGASSSRCARATKGASPGNRGSRPSDPRLSFMRARDLSGVRVKAGAAGRAGRGTVHVGEPPREDKTSVGKAGTLRRVLQPHPDPVPAASRRPRTGPFRRERDVTTGGWSGAIGVRESRSGIPGRRRELSSTRRWSAALGGDGTCVSFRGEHGRFFHQPRRPGAPTRSADPPGPTVTQGAREADPLVLLESRIPRPVRDVDERTGCPLARSLGQPGPAGSRVRRSGSPGVRRRGCQRSESSRLLRRVVCRVPIDQRWLRRERFTNIASGSRGAGSSPARPHCLAVHLIEGRSATSRSRRGVDDDELDVDAAVGIWALGQAQPTPAGGDRPRRARPARSLRRTRIMERDMRTDGSTGRSKMRTTIAVASRSPGASAAARWLRALEAQECRFRPARHGLSSLVSPPYHACGPRLARRGWPLSPPDEGVLLDRLGRVDTRSGRRTLLTWWTSGGWETADAGVRGQVLPELWNADSRLTGRRCGDQCGARRLPKCPWIRLGRQDRRAAARLRMRHLGRCHRAN